MHNIIILFMFHLCEPISVPPVSSSPPTIDVQGSCEKLSVYVLYKCCLYCVNLFYFSGFFHVFLSEAETGNRATFNHFFSVRKNIKL